MSTSPDQIAADATFTYNYLDAFIGRGGAVDHIWSICVEEHCYLLLALVAVLSRRQARKAGPLLLTLSILAMLNGVVEDLILNPDDPRFLFWRSDVRAASVLLPVALFLMGWSAVKIPRIVVLMLIVSGFVLALGISPLSTTAGTTALALAIWHIGALPYLVSALSIRPLTWIGRCSFSIYVWQQPFYRYSYLIVDELRHLPILVRIASQGGLVLAALACGLVSFYLFENPVRRILNARSLAKV